MLGFSVDSARNCLFGLGGRQSNLLFKGRLTNGISGAEALTLKDLPPPNKGLGPWELIDVYVYSKGCMTFYIFVLVGILVLAKELREDTHNKVFF